MTRDYETKAMYEQKMIDIRKSEKNWKTMCRLAGQLYRYEFDNILLILAQRPRATLVADYDTWKKVDRYVQRGSKGIKIFQSRALDRYARHVFDITDTGGKNQKLTWDLEGETLNEFLQYLVEKGDIPPFGELEEKQNLLKNFTGTYVRDIIKEDFDVRLSELKQLSVSKNIVMDDETQEQTEIAELLMNSILYTVGTRCGLELSVQEQDCSQIVKISEEDIVYRLGTLVCDVSCSVLRNISNQLKQMENERRMLHGSNGHQVLREGRITLSRDQYARGAGTEIEQSREVWKNGNAISQGTSESEIHQPLPIREVSREDGGSERGGISITRSGDGIVSGETQSQESELHHGDVETTRASEDGSRGSGTSSDCIQVPLDEQRGLESQEELNQELNRELKELDSFGQEREATYHQASLFDGENQNGSTHKYTYLEPKKELEVPQAYITEVLQESSGFVGGKKRIYELFQNEVSATERAKKIKAEYGQGGRGWPIEGYGLHGYDTIWSKGITIRWRDEEGEKQGVISWKRVEKELATLILLGTYYQPPEELEIVETVLTKASIHSEEHEDEMQEGTFEPEVLTDDEIEAILESDRQRAEERYEREQEDKMVTYLEYGAEIVEEEKAYAKSQEKHNFHHNLWEIETGGAKTRYQWNIEAIQTLKLVEGQERMATPEEQKILSRYVGWGGLPSVFDEKNETWSKEYVAVKALLTREEYVAARGSVNNAFYTSPEVASCMHQALLEFGFRKGNMLEPSMGIGNFFGTLPTPLKNCNLYGVELDSISGRIGRLLYPKATIEIGGFEETTYSDNFFDVAIGNVPFGDYKLYDPKYNKYNFRIHDYFFSKAIDQVRPGGIIAFITSKGTLDKSNPTIRKYMAQRAELIGAIRLPNTAFRDNAGTDVTSDIIFLKKRERIIDIEPDWVHLGYTSEGISVNSYFVEHPEMMLGQTEYDHRIFGANSKYTTCVNHDESFDLYASLQRAVKNLKAHMTDFEHLEEGIEEEQGLTTIPANPDVKNFTYTFQDGELYFRENSLMVQKEMSKVAKERIQHLDRIRSVTRGLITLQLEGCLEETLIEKQKQLNQIYDTFVKKHGYITSKGNRTAFRDDSDYPLLCSLEEVSEDGIVRKADMFSKQTIKPKTVVERVETAVEALNVSMNEYGAVNLGFMLSIYEPNEELPKEEQLELILKELTGVIYLNPMYYQAENPMEGWETADEYLSGNVREKLRIAKAMVEEQGETFAGNVQALEQVQPDYIEAADIDIRIGTAWIEPEDYQLFIYELLNTPMWSRKISGGYGRGIEVKLNKYNLQWFVENKSMDKHSVSASKTYGTKRMDAYSIFEDTLNLRTVTVRDRIEDGDGKYHYEVNKNETMLAREKQNKMKDCFKEWLFSDLERRQKYVEYYNETFNNTRLREYDGSHLTFPGMSPEIELLPHQKNAVARILLGGNTLLAHCVGSGKTFEMMAACMESKRLGLSNKTAIVVPKPLIGQTASEFLRLYPSANILVATEYDFEKTRRKQFVARIATGDYDAIIMSHSQFEKIPISRERKERMLNQQIDDISYAIEDLREQNGERWSIKQMEGLKKKLTEQLKTLTEESRKDDLITFEELGIDSIMVDEAHAFKNLAIFSKMNNVAGISGMGAKKSMDMYLKTLYLNEINENRGIVFATGTPISNTMCEMYVMQMYLQKQALEQRGIFHFDAWAANFGEVTTALELNVEGSGFRFKSRFNKFTNLPELMTMFKEVADVQTPDMLDLNVPALRGEKYNIVESTPSLYVEEQMKDFVVRAERIRGGLVEPSEDNFLKITHEARLLGTDPRLLDTQAPNDSDSKLNKVVANVLAEHQLALEEGKIGCQLIFSDIGTPGADKVFDVYTYIKEELVKGGIREEEISFIHDAKTDASREKLFKEMRSGKKKILIGSTDKCGTGVNVQKYLVAMHHVDCPWKPSSIEQREGRGIRQGNENKEVAIYRYVTKGTFDAYSWSLVENKQRFISQVMTSKSVSRSCEDIDEATLSYAEIKAVATGNPMIKEKMELDNDVQRLKLLKSSYDNQRYSLQDDYMVRFPKLITAAKEKIACVKADIVERNLQLETPLEFAITVGNVTYTERTDGGAALLSAISDCKTGDSVHIAEYKGFDVLVKKNFMVQSQLILQGKTQYPMELSTSPVGNMVKLENVFQDLEKHQEFLEKKLEQYQRDMSQSKLEYEKPFPQEQELKEKIERQNELNVQLDLENGQVETLDLGAPEQSQQESQIIESEQEQRLEERGR